MRGVLLSHGIDGSGVLVEQPLQPPSARGLRVCELQVRHVDFERASKVIADAHATPARPESRQFSLRALLLLITAAGLVLAVVRVVGLARTFWGVAAMTGGIVCVASGTVGGRSACESRHWPTTRGRIVEARLGELNHNNFDGHITYGYQVDGREYTGHAVRYCTSYPGMISNYNFLRSEIVRYPAGLEVEVHYNPERPKDAFLEPGARGRDRVVICLVGCAFVAFGVACLCGLIGSTSPF